MAVCSSALFRGWLAAILAAPFLLLLTLTSISTSANAQVIGTDPRNRSCQTILTCNYSKGGYFRGCLSSYSCRVCSLQPVRCTASDLASGRTRCTEFVCRWGG
jgi:hypothetical protein